MVKKGSWSEEEDRRLLELRDAGRTSVSIANAMKRTVGAVDNRLWLLRSKGGMLKPLPMVESKFFPCIPTRGSKVPAGPDWIHEIKHNGYRMIVQRDGNKCGCSPEKRQD
jgi:ATP-dependent DNA ligase